MCNCNGHDNIFLPRKATIVKAKMMTPSEKHFILKMQDGKDFDYEPGQIVEAGIPGYGEIPLGISSSPTQKETFELVVRRVGKVSTALLNLKDGDTMYIRGPLGKGFPIDEFKNKNVLIVAGGIGLCPTRSMIRYIMDRRKDFKKFTLFFGSRNQECRLFLDDLKDWEKSPDVDFHETLDQGDPTWGGNVGVITTLFAKTKLESDTRVIVCGPPVMYKFVLRELSSAGVTEDNVFVDLERRMKCGVGKCGHCQINDVYVCIDGPVFRYSDIKNLEEAF
jgi:sulfite reductase subunit B